MLINLLQKLGVLEKTAMIVRRGGNYFVISEKTGRILGGPYKSKADAIRRLRQVEYFKRIKKSDIITRRG